MQHPRTVSNKEHHSEVLAAIELLRGLLCGPKPTLPYDYETWRLGEYLLARGWAIGTTTTGLDISSAGRKLLKLLHRVGLHERVIRSLGSSVKASRRSRVAQGFLG